MNLRDLCTCGHVRKSHDGSGPCKTCSACAAWRPAYRVFDDALPAGVYPVRDVSNGLTLIACSHAERHPSGRCRFCNADPWMTEGHTLPVQRLAFVPQTLTLL